VSGLMRLKPDTLSYDLSNEMIILSMFSALSA